MMLPFALEIAAHGEREIHARRAFRAPRELVFDAMTKPDLLPRWLTGPPGWVMSTCEVDLRVGGSYRWGWTQPGQPNLLFEGKFIVIERPERLVHTERMEEPPMPGESRNEIVLTEHAGVTLMEMKIQHASKEAREAAIASGMGEGMEYSYKNLDQLLLS